ncbi:MAG: DNA polymerase III subunit beta [Clostridiales bacterium]|jgi:DNA polymerase-3 subunit beta|nr:DNA polymerase III subunit beta [Clostridiales bacterium]
MKFTCDRTALTDAVGIVQRAVASRSTLAVLEGILIKAKGGKVTLTGNDLEIGIEAVIGAEVSNEGKVVVNSALFGNIIRKMSGDTVTVDVAENHATELKCGNSNIRLNGISGDEFPEIPGFDTELDLALSQKEFKDLIRHTIFAVGTSESKLILTGCLLEASANNVSMVAVDGFRLALKKIVSEAESVSSGDAAIVIPAKTLREINSIIGDSDDKITIRCSQKNVRLEFDNVIFTSRLLEGDYIDYKKIIPTEFKTRIKADLKPLIEAVDRASVIITSEATKSPLTVKIADGVMQLRCETNAGKVDEVVPVEMRGDEIEIGFNNKYLLEALKAAEGDEAYLEFIGPVNPCLITPVEGDSFKFIVLPVRLRSDS